MTIELAVTGDDPVAEACPSCGTPAGRHCATWCELNGTSWDELD